MSGKETLSEQQIEEEIATTLQNALLNNEKEYASLTYKLNMQVGQDISTIQSLIMAQGGSVSGLAYQKSLLESEIEILVSLGDGDGVATAWGCDLTYDYVKINGDYRT